ncbi:d801a66d-6d08-415e-b422-57f868d5264b [Thermothielavioides terrestris]|uniref:D801a66d-6d08-415e-b422-57f868d5264b n=1 Tax=Thermothielavioides terrestris TaxID=2587410 RepID=A0A446BN49_9PEZI|nr:d801a66d-6d08-415e-b422-57f868d5264b [Thermothielavioides terrestris]
MAARGVSVLKFVGTVSLGVLTGLSYTLSSLTIPALLTLPRPLLLRLRSRLHPLPRPLRHPYLLYVSTLVLGSHFAASDLLAPYLLFLGPARPASSAAAAGKERQKEMEKRAAARARMEASYEVLGGAGSDATSEGSTGEEMEAEADEAGDVNGEEVRAQVEAFLKKQIVRSALAGLGFLLSVVGIWGDGVSPVYEQAVILEV